MQMRVVDLSLDIWIEGRPPSFLIGNAVNILVANDDGVFALGLAALIAALKLLGRVIVVAPDSERSGASSSVSLDSPLRPIEIQPDIWAVNGTPADCVFLAVNGFLNIQFDLVVTGINSGANLAEDVLYSGTVGAAFEAAWLDIPTLAVSLAGPRVKHYQHPQDYAAAAQWVHDYIVQGLIELPPRHIFNINIPDIPKLNGVRYTYQAKRTRTAALKHDINPRGRTVCWIGLSGEQQADPTAMLDHACSDLTAIAQGYVSISPIQMDQTNYSLLKTLQKNYEMAQID